MIEIYGAFLEDLPTTDELKTLLEPMVYQSWMQKHHDPQNEQVLRLGQGALWLLSQAGVTGTLDYDADGRPYFVDSNLDFNITHTDRAVFCAIARTPEDGRVGIDAERLDRVSTLRSMALAERWFTGEERRMFAKAPTVETFLAVWTRKEALVKWTGEGMRALKNEDTTTAGERYGVQFDDYRVGDTAVTFCHRADVAAPTEIQMLRRK